MQKFIFNLYYNKFKKAFKFSSLNGNFFFFKLFKIVKNNLIFFNNLRNYNTFLKSFKKYLTVLKYGFFYSMFFKGIGYYFYKYKNILLVDFGFSNFIGINIPKNIIIQRFKTKITIFSFNLNLLNRFITLLSNMKKNNVYKQKGLYFVNKEIKQKIITKKAK